MVTLMIAACIIMCEGNEMCRQYLHVFYSCRDIPAQANARDSLTPTKHTSREMISYAPNLPLHFLIRGNTEESCTSDADHERLRTSSV